MTQALIGILGIGGTLLLVGVGLLNYSVFRRQLDIAQRQIDAAMRQLALAQRQPDMQLIARAISETSDHARSPSTCATAPRWWRCSSTPSTASPSQASACSC